MRRELPAGYELDHDRERVDVDAVYRFLAGVAYWAPGRDRGTIERLVRDPPAGSAPIAERSSSASHVACVRPKDHELTLVGRG